jgi:hypothetical protein
VTDAPSQNRGVGRTELDGQHLVTPNGPLRIATSARPGLVATGDRTCRPNALTSDEHLHT